MARQAQSQSASGLAIAGAKAEVKRPPLYKVVLINDDYTPMDFVVQILEHFFDMPLEKAVQVMLAIHTQGKGECGVFSYDVAQTLVIQVNGTARSFEYPLLCQMEKI